MGVSLELTNISKFIENVEFFKPFSDHETHKLTGDKSTFKQFSQGEDIFKEGEPGASLFVVLYGDISLFKISEFDAGEGRVSLKEGKERAVGELGVGAVFGEISLLTGRKRSVTARINSPKAILMEITNRYIDSLIPSIRAKFHKQLLFELVKDLDDMDTRYLKLQASIDGTS